MTKEKKEIGRGGLMSRGFAMGLAEVVPGVSGGTIAFITGIYERLLSAIKAFDLDLLKMLFRGQFKAIAVKIDLVFLLFLFSGMLIGIVGGVFGVTWILDNYPLHLWAFFFSLIAASCFIVYADVKKQSIQTWLFLLLGVVIAIWVTSSQPASGSESYMYIFLSGFLAISALMLPGLSGSFVLLLLGVYTTIIPAFKDFLSGDISLFPILLAFGLGCIVGVVSLSRVLHWGFNRYPNSILMLLIGFMLGSLHKIWPWQEVLSVRVNSKGEEVIASSRAIGPGTFSHLEENPIFGTDPYTLTLFMIMMGTFILITYFGYASKKK